VGHNYTGSNPALLTDKVVRECYLILIRVSAELTLRYNDSSWDLEHPASVWWTGAGDAIRVELPEEDATLAANPCTIYLSSTNPALTSLVLSTPMTNALVQVYHGLFTPDYILVGGPALAFSGLWSHAELVNLDDEDA
jgi:hypothetical protein